MLKDDFKVRDDFKDWMVRVDGQTQNVANSYAAYLNALFRELYDEGFLPIQNVWGVLDKAYHNYNNVHHCNNDRTYFNLILAMVSYSVERAYNTPGCRITQTDLNNGRSALRKLNVFI